MAGVVATFAMDIVATQPSTIPLHNGAYLAEEFDDVLCILQPASQSAMTVCQNIWKETPQFILQYSKAGLRADGTVREDDDLQMIGEADTQGARPYEPSKFPNTHEYVQVIAQNAGEENECDVLNNGEMKTDVVEETQPIQPTNLDVALRTSAVVKSFVLGFVFGRDLQKSDIQLSTGSLGDVRISSMHFRIYLNRFGILMLEDTSTNGTTVDEESLGKSYKNRTKILSHSSTIEFVTNANRATKAVEKATFVVKLPKRNDAQYKANLQHYVLKIIRHKQEREQITGGTLFPKPAITNKTQANSDLVSNLDLLSAGTEKNTLANGWTANGKYQVNSELGKGAFAIVYKITTITGGEVQAAKRIDRSAFMKNGALGGKFLNELQIMQKVDHVGVAYHIHTSLTIFSHILYASLIMISPQNISS